MQYGLSQPFQAPTPAPSPHHPTTVGGASCPGRGPSGNPAPGVAGTAARGRQGEPGPAGPSRTSTTSSTPATPSAAPDAVAAHYRLRLHEPRENRVCPRFNDAEEHTINTAATLCELWPGAFIALATDALVRVSTAGQRRWLEAVIQANEHLAMVGVPLNDYARHLNSGGTPGEHAYFLLGRVEAGITDAVTAVTHHPTDIEPADQRLARIAEAVARHRRRTPGERRDNRIKPRFSPTEWHAITRTATTCRIKPGKVVAAAALDAAHAPDPRAAIADPRRRLEELLESNRLLAALGNNLNQIQRQLPPGHRQHTTTQRVLGLAENAIDQVDTTAADLAGRLTA